LSSQKPRQRWALPGFGAVLGVIAMHIRVSHASTYTYSRPVRLAPHWLRLRPRCDGGAELLDFTLEIDPQPAGRSDCLDAEGNLVTRVWFRGEAARLVVTSSFEVDTRRADPYDYLPDPAPWDGLYAPDLEPRLAPWTASGPQAPSVLALARGLREASADAHEFMHRLNDQLHRQIDQEIRDTGQAHAPEETLRRGRGACRDLAVLFVAACRSQGLAARFVSGYQSGGYHPRRYMHAWAEVYLPGAGWRGFDPTHGRAVAGHHVAVAAAARAEDAAPIEGGFLGAAHATLRAEVRIDAAD
jgi:transglutaminase-like putative cysteine protease